MHINHEASFVEVHSSYIDFINTTAVLNNKKRQIEMQTGVFNSFPIHKKVRAKIVYVEHSLRRMTINEI